MTRRPVSLAYAAEARRRRIVRAAWYGGQAVLVAALIGTGCMVWPADAAQLRVDDGEAATVQIFGGLM